jgi:hypothetical protein
MKQMKRKTCLVVLAGFLVGLVACTSDPDDLKLLDSGFADSVIYVSQAEQVTIKPTLSTSKQVEYSWSINNEKVSNEPLLQFSQKKVGDYLVKFEAKLDEQSISHQWLFSVFPPFRKETSTSNAFIDSVLAYVPAPGQFINTAAGTLDAARKLARGKDNGVVTLGAFGGYLIARFDHTVINRSGDDLIVFANAHSGSSEPGIVQVSYDANQNGLPDDDWFELKGENHHEAIRNYEITYMYSAPDQDIQWIDSQGNKGSISKNSYHSQDYFPHFATTAKQISFSGTLLPSNQSQNEAGQWIWNPMGKGYVDNFSSEFSTNFANLFDIDNAIDNHGNPISLFGIDFVRIYTAVFVSNNVIGEASTEVRGIADLNSYRSNSK